MMEVSCKAASGKSVCAFPDVCMTPPQTSLMPPGIPVPYPNTGMASDCTGGSTSVKISGQEVMLKNKSCFKRSTGDEAGSASKKGMLSSKNMGKVYFTMWSMNVKVEGENVVRHLDLTTHNHGSFPGNTTTWPYLSSQSPKKDEACGEEHDRQQKACDGVDDPCGCVGKEKPSGRKDSPEASNLADQTAANKCSAAQTLHAAEVRAEQVLSATDAASSDRGERAP